MLGYSRDEMIGMHVSQWDVGIPKDELMHFVNELFKQETRAEFETRHTRKDGTTYDAEISGCPVQFGEEWVYFCATRDITERKRMEDRLKASEQRLSEILNLMPIAVFIKDTESRVTMMNHICESQWGIRISELQNTTGSHIFPPEQMEVFLAADKKIFVDGKTFEIEELIWNSELQANRIIHTYKKPVFNERGEPDYLIGISVDVTEATRQEQALKESEERLILSQEYGEIGSWEADLINNTQIWSATAYQILGLPIDQNTQTWEKFLDLVHVDDRQKVVDASYTHLAQKEKYDVEYRAITATGEIRWLRSAGRAQFLDDGTPFKFIGIVQDVTERHMLEIELKRSNTDLEQFAYAVSHDMRQPLRMVTSYLALIETALATQLDDDTRQFLTFAVEGAKRMDSMILSLLDYSRVGRSTEAFNVISSRAAVEEALLFLKPALETSGGTVEVLGDWIDLIASRDELMRLLQNLIGNALKYHEENKPPVVEISASVTSNTFRVEVRDSGIGINPNQIDRLFKVFSRLQARSRFEGTGVGLALCRKIVEHHGGKIGVDSQGEGLGSVFWFELPIVNNNELN